MKPIATALLLLSLATQPALAAMYRCTDNNGATLYTNDNKAGRNCSLIANDKPVSVIPRFKGGSASTPTPGNFPRVTTEQQQRRDQTRLQALQSEMDDETRKLSAAKNELAKAKDKLNGQPETPEQQQQLQLLQDQVDQHQRNIDALQQEMARIR